MFVFLTPSVYRVDGAAPLPWAWRERGGCLERGGFRAGSFPSNLLARLEQIKGVVFSPTPSTAGLQM